MEKDHARYKPGESVEFIFSLSDLLSGKGVSGKTVTFSVSPDDGTVSFSTTSTSTDKHGTAETKLILGRGASGSYRVTATLDDGQSVTDLNIVRLVYNPTPLDFYLSMYIPRGAIPVKPGESRTFIAKAQKKGNYVSGKTVTFSVSPDDGTVSLSPTSAITDSNGTGKYHVAYGERFLWILQGHSQRHIVGWPPDHYKWNCDS